MAVAAKEWPLVKARQNDDEEGHDLNTEEEEDDNQDSRHQEQQLQHNKKKDNNVQVDDTTSTIDDDTGKKSKKRRRSLSPPNCNRNEITSTTPSLKDLLVGNDVSFTHCHKYNSNDNTTSNCIATSLQNYDNIKNNITEDINAENTTNKSVQHYQKKSKYFHTKAPVSAIFSHKKTCTNGGVSSQLSSGKHSSRLNDDDSIQEDSSNPDPNSLPPSYETTIARYKKQLEINKVEGIPTNKIPLPPKGGILSIDIGIVANTVNLNGYTGETQYEKAILESSALVLRRNQGKPLPASVDATVYQCKPKNVNTNAEIEAMDLPKRDVHRVGGSRKNFYGEGSSRKNKMSKEDYAQMQEMREEKEKQKKREMIEFQIKFLSTITNRTELQQINFDLLNAQLRGDEKEVKQLMIEIEKKAAEKKSKDRVRARAAKEEEEILRAKAVLDKAEDWAKEERLRIEKKAAEKKAKEEKFEEERLRIEKQRGQQRQHQQSLLQRQPSVFPLLSQAEQQQQQQLVQQQLLLNQEEQRLNLRIRQQQLQYYLLQNGTHQQSRLAQQLLKHQQERLLQIQQQKQQNLVAYNMQLQSKSQQQQYLQQLQSQQQYPQQLQSQIKNRSTITK